MQALPTFLLLAGGWLCAAGPQEPALEPDPPLAGIWKGDAILRVRRERVHRHYFLRVSICFRLIEIDLRVESLLANSNHQSAGLRHLLRHAARGGGQLLRRYYLVDQSPCGGSSSVHSVT